jgi:stage III sporulation protein AG
MERNLNQKVLIEWIKNPKNKAITRFAFLFILGLLMLSLGKLLTVNSIERKEFLTDNLSNPSEQNMTIIEPSYEKKLEKQLADLLQQVNGVGEVKVMITLEDEIMIEPAFNTINTEKTSEERDNEGGVRTVIEKQINKQAVLLRRSGDEEAMILGKTTPRIKGILIVADGAFSSKIKEKIIKSTATLLDIPMYKISVLEK